MIDISNFKLLKEDDKSYNIAHPNGRTVTVDKAGLSDKAQKAIAKLKGAQGLDSGGIDLSIADPELALATGTTALAGGNLGETMPQVENSPLAPPGYVPPTPAPVAPEDQAAAFSPMVNPAELPPQTGSVAGNNQTQIQQQPQQNAQDDAYKRLQQSYEEGMGILNKTSGVVGASGAAAQKALTDYANQVGPGPNQNAELKNYQTELQNYQAQNQALAQGVMNQKIDPNHLWNSSSTGSKIAAGIGLILGGIGSGLTHQPNLAAEMINQSVERDVQAQMNDQSKAMNLYKMNQENLGNARQAYLATKAQLLTVAQAQVQSAQMGANTALSQNNLALQANQLKTQVAQLDYNRALMADNVSDPAAKIRFLVPPAQQNEAYAALDNAKNISMNMGKINDLFDAAAQDVGGFSPGAAIKDVVKENPSRAALDLLGTSMLKDREGKANPAAVEAYRNNLPAFLDTNEGLQTKKKAINDLMNGQMNTGSSLLSNYGINLPQFTKMAQRPQRKPGDVVQVSGRPGYYQVGPDANTLTPVE